MTDPNFRNRTLFQGDNLEMLRGINSETVDLIYADPPFKKGREFYATPDSLAAGASFSDKWKWSETVEVNHQDWVDELQDDWPKVWRVIQAVKDNGDESMAAYLCWLAVRLLECHRVLKKTGSLYLHIDHTAHAYVKVIMDAIFGIANFRNEIVWCYSSPSMAQRWFPRKHDTILFYVKDDKNSVFNPKANRVPHKLIVKSLKKFGHAGEKARPRSEEELLEGRAPFDWWEDITDAYRQPKEYKGYPTQKPLALLERVIKASSNPGDTVLDPFAGCATAPVAAERLGRQWIAMDIWKDAHQMILDRLSDEKRIWRPEEIQLVTEPPIRTDAGETASDYLPEVEGIVSHKPKFSKDVMKSMLLEKWGVVCWACGFEPPNKDARFFDLDHNNPKAAGGSHELDNRSILCRPCNGAKSDKMTLTELRRKNKSNGIWYGAIAIDKRIPLPAAADWARTQMRRKD